MLRASVIWHDESEWGVLCYNEQQRMNKKRENFRNQTAKTSFTTLASWIRTTSLVYHLTKITTIIRLTVLVLLFWLEMNPTSHHPDKCGPNKKKCPHHRAIDIGINGPRVDRRFSTTAGGDSDPSGISELFRLLDDSTGVGSSRPIGAGNSLLLRRRADTEFGSDLINKTREEKKRRKEINQRN